jgi:hypothetical protein
MNWLQFRCPGCQLKKSVVPGDTYTLCARCATAHCDGEGDLCRVEGCKGSLHEAINLGGGAARFPDAHPPVHYDPKL